MTNPVSKKHGDNSESYATTNSASNVSETQLRPRSQTATRSVKFSEETPSTINNLIRSRNIPKIQEPELSTINLIALLKEFQRTNSLTDTRLAMLDATQINFELDNQRANDIENKATLRSQQATMDETSASKKVWSWILAIGSLIVAVVAVCLAGAVVSAFTGGAAIPVVVAAVVALIGAVIGVIASALSVVNLALQEAPKHRNVFGEEVALEISLTALINFCEEKRVENGTEKVIGVNATSDTPGAITRKAFDKRKDDRTMAINITFACVMIIICIASIASAAMSGVKAGATIVEKTVEGAAEAATQAGSRAQLIASAASAGASVLIAGGSAFNAYLSLSLGTQRKNRSESLIIEKTIESAIQALQQQFDANQQHFRSAMNFQETLRSRIANVMADFYETSITIAKNTKV